jgi:hypothetical protein
MGKHVKINFLKISIWIVVSILLGLVVYFLDVVLFQKIAVIFLENYSDVVLSVWEIQATVATLTIAVTAFIIGKFNNNFYGISVKELLYFPRKKERIMLSFWDAIFTSILIITISWFFAILNNIASITVILLISLLVTEYIVHESIIILTKPEQYSEFAHSIVDKIIATILENPMTYEQWEKKSKSGKTEWEPTQKQLDARVKFESIVENIDRKIKDKIREGVVLDTDDTFRFFETTILNFNKVDEAALNVQLFNILIDWLRAALDKEDRNNVHSLLDLSLYAYKHNVTDGLIVFLRAYYSKGRKISFYIDIIDQMCKQFRQAIFDESEKVLVFIKFSIDQADRDLFRKTIKAVWQIHSTRDHKYQGKVTLVAYAYLYYLIFREKYLREEKGSDFIEKLNEFQNIEIRRDMINGIEVITNFKDLFRNHADTILAETRFLLDLFGVSSRWEYWPAGEMKWMQINYDAKRFLAFVLFKFFKRKIDFDFSILSKDELADIKKYINDDGILSEEVQKGFNDYMHWLGENGVKTRNELLASVLIDEIRARLVLEMESIRENKEGREERLKELNSEVLQALQTSSLCMSSPATGMEPIFLPIEGIFTVKNFSDHSYLHGIGDYVRQRIELIIYENVKDALEKIVIENPYVEPDTVFQTIARVIDELREEGIIIDQIYNMDGLEELESTRLSEVNKEQLRKLLTRVRNAGSWYGNYYSTVYVDSSKMDVGFRVPSEDFMTITEELTEEEITEEMEKCKVPTGYVYYEYSNSVGVPFDENQLRDFFRTTLFKITFHVEIYITHAKIGFYTMEKGLSTEIAKLEENDI